MLKISGNKILVNRGDIAVLTVSAKNKDGSNYIFKVDDVVRFKIMKVDDCSKIYLQKDTIVTTESSELDISLTSDDTRIGSLISTPTDYWYEIELNPDTEAQTIIGYDTDGPKIFTLYPEGGKKR